MPRAPFEHLFNPESCLTRCVTLTYLYKLELQGPCCARSSYRNHHGSGVWETNNTRQKDQTDKKEPASRRAQKQEQRQRTTKPRAEPKRTNRNKQAREHHNGASRKQAPKQPSGQRARSKRHNQNRRPGAASTLEGHESLQHTRDTQTNRPTRR